MAKLNGVKTIDMVNGEITKIEYNGAEYTKVDDGQVGDIGLVVDAWGDQLVGEYYEIKTMSEECYRMEGKLWSASCYKRRMKPFRKIVVQTPPTIEERVTTLESDIAALKSSDVKVENYDFKAGDIVVVKSLDKWFSYGSKVKIGDIGKVGSEGDFGGSVRVIVPGGSSTANFVDKSEIRKATPAEVEQYEKELAKASFSTGDYVKIVKSQRNNEGVIGIITEIGAIATKMVDGTVTTQPILIKHLTGKESGTLSAGPADHIIKATEEEIAEVLKPKLKSGDFVKWTDGSNSLPNGEIFEVFEDVNGVYVIDNDGTKRYTALSNPLFKYEIVDAETAKWAKIGRKVTEYRKGDIIEYGCYGEYTMPPRFFKVSEIIGNDVRFFSNDHGNETEYMPSDSQSIRLVAPVESLFTTQN